MPTSDEPHEKCVSARHEADDDHQHEAGQREIRGAPAAPPGRAEREEAAVDEPRDERHRHQRVESTAVSSEPDEPGDHPERQQRQRDGDRPWP